MNRKPTIKLFTSLLLVLALLTPMAAFASESTYTPGAYTGTAKGFGGDVTVTVTVDGNAITNVEAIGDSETAGIGTRALEALPEAIVAANGIPDVISGATVTSDAIISALEDALALARGESLAVAGAPVFVAGTYTGTATGYNGPVELSVTFSEDAITGIEILQSSETAHVGASAYDIVFQDVMAFTSTGVDTVSGATVTSNAILRAVENAAAQAGCDMDALRQGAIPFAYTPGEKIVDSYDVVVIGAGGAGMAAAAAAAQSGATVIVLEKMVEMGGNTLVAGGSFQAVQPSLLWDANDPDATEGINEFNGEPVAKVKMDAGRLVTLQMILDWEETPFDGTVEDPDAIQSVDDYDLPSRGVHEAFLPTLLTLKDQVRAYMAYADEKMAAGAKETDLTLFSTVELHVFQTYYGGIRLNYDKSEWITNDYDLVYQMCSQALDAKAWLIDQGSLISLDSAGTLIGCLWQRINRVQGGIVDGEQYSGNWGTYFKVPENTVLSANPKNTIMYRTTATELIYDGERVTGVKAVQYDGTEVELTANGGVVVATGGYGANIPMVLETNQYWDVDDLRADIKTTNRNLAQGEGIVMAEAVGADITGMGWTQLMPLGWVDNGNLAGGTGENVIYIGPKGSASEGKRYVDEAAERDVLSQGAYDNGIDNGVYVELGNSGTNTNANNLEGRRYFCTLEEASELLGIDAAVLEETIRGYDAYVIGATDTPPTPAKSAYRGTIGTCDKDENGNYLPDTYRIETFMVRFMKPSTHHTMGGLVVDLERHVLNTDGETIPGLYAAGEVTGNFFAGNRLGGNAITEIIVSGRIAGENAAASK